ncbi:recombinase family protein, partial [Escherichia coli]|uniref:recombinase family protein n=1 Tax=Escherichia coli TaxID=562 RepID=UPI001FF1A41A
MKKAIAYMRFSSPGQMSGDSLNRQRRLIAEWLKVNSDYYLDTITYEDLGLSAFKGKHAQSGAFSEFLDAIWICPYISRHLLSLNPLLACCRRYSRG